MPSGETEGIKHRRPVTMDRLQAAAARRGGICVSDGVATGHAAMEWKCSRGHVFTMRADYVLYAKTWCRECSITQQNETRLMKDSDRKRSMFDMCQAAAAERGGRCLSREYNNWKATMEWQCSQGHVFTMMAGTVLHGAGWCRKCGLGKRLANRKRVLDRMRAKATTSPRFPRYVDAYEADMRRRRDARYENC